MCKMPKHPSDIKPFSTSAGIYEGEGGSRKPSSSPNTYTISRMGIGRWEWEARGVLRRAIVGPSIVVLPVPGYHATTVGRGVCLTRKAAQRKARKALAYYCEG